jgi:hypothetical protein
MLNLCPRVVYQYRNEALEKIAIEWLDAHQITYKRGRLPLPTE